MFDHDSHELNKLFLAAVGWRFVDNIAIDSAMRTGLVINRKK